MVVPAVAANGNGGGIVSAAQYWSEGWRARALQPPLRLVAARGGGSVWLSPAYLLVCLGRLFLDALFGRVDLVHVNVSARASTWRKLPVVVLARLLRLPVIVHLHSGEYPGFYAQVPAIGKRMIRWMFRAADRVIVLGDRWRRFVVAELDVPPARVAVLHNAIPAPPGQDRPGMAAKGDVPRIVFVGLVAQKKGLDDLLAALAGAELQPMSWHLTVAGQGEVKRYKAMAESLGIGARVDFAGWLSRDDLQSLYRTSDVFVLPSYGEGLSNALLEAMAHGLAIVATPVGAHEEAVAEGRDGLLVRPGRTDELAQALVRLLASEAERRRFGDAARARFLAQFEINACLDRMRAIHGEARDAARTARPGSRAS